MTNTRKTSLRTCVACRTQTDKRNLIRFVRDADGETHVDLTGKAPGRGASVCPSSACFERAVAKKRLNEALRTTLAEEDVDRLRTEFENALAVYGERISEGGR